MIKAVATAFVLIAGAAVVLWYGSTLNSWVLGGLIGGLAALLLSIPISLTLFSFFSRHRNAQHQDEHAILVQGEVSLAQHGAYALPHGRGMRERYEIEEGEDDLYEEEEYPEDYDDEFENAYDAEYEEMEERFVEKHGPRSRRAMWVDEDDEQASHGSSARHLPAPSSSYASTPDRSRRARPFPAAQRDEAEQLQSYGQGKKNVSTPRPLSRRTGYMSSVGYQADPMRSRYRSEALRAARQEAAQQAAFDYGIEETPPPRPRRYGARSLPTYAEQDHSQASGRFSASESMHPYPRHPRRVVDSLPPQRSRHTDPLTEDERMDMFDRNSNLPQDYGNTRQTGESLRKPLVRRAPYTYEDDPVRREMTHQTERPIVRRSSRYLSQRDDDSTN